MNPTIPFIKTILKKQFLLASVVLIGLFVTNFVYAKEDLECSAPFVPQNGKCVLTEDKVIDKTVHLSSDITYDGQGHKLIAAQEGVVDDSTTSTIEYQTSIPEVAMLADQAHRFSLKNLTFEHFDFDLVVLDAKNDPAEVQKTHISNCQFSAKYLGVFIVKADDILLNQNVFDGIGVAVLIFRDSDRNQVKHFDVTNRANNLGRVPIFPGNRRLIAAGSFPACAIRWGRGFPFPSEVLTLEIDGTSYQFPLSDLNQNPGVVPEDNLFEGNTIHFTGNAGFTGYDLSDRSIRTILRGSKITGQPQFGIFISGTQGSTVTSPGTCSDNSSRICARDNDCRLSPTSLATCEGEVFTFQLSQTEETHVEENMITTPSRNGILIALTDNPIILNNFISGAGLAGVFVESRARGTATIKGNMITQSGHGNFTPLNRGGITLFPTGDATPYGAAISLNHLAGNFRAIGTRSDYSFNTNLIADGKGNFYRDCSDSDGFRDSNEPDQNGQTDSPSPFITDTHPLSESPVFQDEDGFVHLKEPLPPTCAE